MQSENQKPPMDGAEDETGPVRPFSANPVDEPATEPVAGPVTDESSPSGDSKPESPAEGSGFEKPTVDVANLTSEGTFPEPAAPLIENNGSSDLTIPPASSSDLTVPPAGSPISREELGTRPPVNLFQRPSDSSEAASSPPAPGIGSSYARADSVPVSEPASPLSRPVDSKVSAPPLTGSTPAAPEARQRAFLSPPPLASVTPPVAPVTPPLPIQPTQTEEARPKGLLDIYDSEELMCEVDSGDDGRFVLTSQRLIYQGRSSEGSLFSAAAVEDVTAIEFGRRPRDSRSAWWGSIGLLASIAVWQVTTNETVGAVAGAIVAGISLLLIADYWFRPAGLILRFGTAGGTVEGPVSSKRVQDAEELAARVQQMKQPDRRGNTAGRPPGGSPGIG